LGAGAIEGTVAVIRVEQPATASTNPAVQGRRVVPATSVGV